MNFFGPEFGHAWVFEVDGLCERGGPSELEPGDTRFSDVVQVRGTNESAELLGPEAHVRLVDQPPAFCCVLFVETADEGGILI